MFCMETIYKVEGWITIVSNVTRMNRFNFRKENRHRET